MCYVLSMAPCKTRAKAASRKGGFVLGRVRFEKISAVEGIKTSAASKRMFAEFDRRGLSDAERRAAILQKYKKA